MAVGDDRLDAWIADCRAMLAARAAAAARRRLSVRLRGSSVDHTPPNLIHSIDSIQSTS